MKSLYKIFHPEIFQGSLNSRNYFEGWYFKHVSDRGSEAFAVIPGISLSEDSHSFIQFIDGIRRKTVYFRYRAEEFEYKRKSLEIRIGRSLFTNGGICLDLDDGNTRISGELSYSSILGLPKSILRPGIMGWYSYVPAMECNHGVVSVNHSLSGNIKINGSEMDFTGGKGYIEKDWGTSFPESWIWLQCNSFEDKSTSVMVSVAKIPWRRSFFIGFIAFLSRGGKTEVFATYNGAKVSLLERINDESTKIRITKGKKQLEISVEKSAASLLKAPVSGGMIRNIKESLDSKVFIQLSNGSEKAYTGSGVNAGYEEHDAIFRYF